MSSTFPRANRRPYPSSDRARRQIARAAYVQPCGVCEHPLIRHPVEDGQRVCTHGEGFRVSCPECAEIWARTPALAAVQNFARVLSSSPVRPPRVCAPRAYAGR